MKQKFTFLFAFLSLVLSSTFAAQNATCDGFRYKNFMFLPDSVFDIQFGQSTSQAGVPKTLKMDIYQPKGDVATKRPLVILLHGGSFVRGDKSDLRIMTRAFAQMGYIAATIDYRLIDVLPTDSFVIADAITKGMSDTKAAIQYFMKDAATTNTYRVDTSNIIIGGVSAGAIIADHTGYLSAKDQIPAYFLNLITTNGGFTGNSGTNTSYRTPIKAVLNYSGGLAQSIWISSGDPALLSVHDTGDPIVPCGHAASAAFPFPIYMYGSCEMQPQATAKGIVNQAIYFPVVGHVSYFDNTTTAAAVLVQSANFMQSVICASTTETQAISVVPDFQVYPTQTSQYFKVSLKNENIDKLQIFNTLGVLVKEVLVSKSADINVGNLPTGLYMVRLASNPFKAIKVLKR